MIDSGRDYSTLLRQAAGPRSVVISDKDESVYCVFTTETTSEASGRSFRSDERNRAQQLRTVYEQYTSQQKQVQLVQDYRARIPEFERQMFIDPIRGLLTQCKAELERPTSTTMTDNDYELMRNRLVAPFDYFNKRVNEERQDGSIAGSTAVIEGLLTNWHEGGISGHRMSVASREINGVMWRVPISFLTFGATELHYDEKESTGSIQRWYRRQQSKGFGSKNADIPLWDQPEQGIYAGVSKPGHQVGNEEAWPRVPFLAALDACLTLEMHTRAELHSLTSMDRTIVLWTIDMEKVQAAGLTMEDRTDANGNTIPGVASALRAARDARRAKPGMSMIEYTVGDYIKPVEFTPGHKFLEIANRSLGAEIRVALFAGLRFDPDGKFIESETWRNEAIHYDHWRENVIEPFIQQEVYDPILLENRRWFAIQNNIEPLSEFNPFVWVSPAAKQKLRNPPKSLKGSRKRQELVTQLRLDGEITNLRMLIRMTPSGNRPDSRLQHLINLGRMGYIGPRTLQEAVGADPVLERADLFRMHNDLIQIQNGMKSVFSPPPSNVQVSTTEDGTETKSTRQSTGRPVGMDETEARERARELRGSVD